MGFALVMPRATSLKLTHRGVPLLIGVRGPRVSRSFKVAPSRPQIFKGPCRDFALSDTTCVCLQTPLILGACKSYVYIGPQGSGAGRIEPIRRALLPCQVSRPAWFIGAISEHSTTAKAPHGNIVGVFFMPCGSWNLRPATSWGGDIS